MRKSGSLVKVIRYGRGIKTGAELCIVRYYAGWAGDHTPYICWGPEVTVAAEDVMPEEWEWVRPADKLS